VGVDVGVLVKVGVGVGVWVGVGVEVGVDVGVLVKVGVGVGVPRTAGCAEGRQPKATDEMTRAKTKAPIIRTCEPFSVLTKALTPAG
jgi:hypothetical protein